MITPTRPLFLDHGRLSSDEFERQWTFFFFEPRGKISAAFPPRNDLGRNEKKGKNEGKEIREESNSEENGLVYLKILRRAPMPRLKRIGRNFIHFCPCPLPSAPGIASPRASSRPFGGSNHFASLRQPPRASSSRDSLPPGRAPPSLENGERTRSLPL